MNELDVKNLIAGVQKPARYIGGEFNIARKDITDGMVSVALGYPDSYEIGMSYLGLKILYHILNDRDDCVCERFFSPLPDMENALRASGNRLFALESKKPLNEFDVVGFSLCYELTYTNILNILDLGGIPVFSAARAERDPIVIAGGAGAFNPEPLAAFIDVFFVGDAEETLPAFIEKFGSFRSQGLSRKSILEELAASMGNIYVPAFYEAKYEGGDFSALERLSSRVPETISKGHVKDLDGAFYPVKQVVPYIEVVQDRIAVEIMRGCPNRCRFCQASEINTPVRVRKPDTILKICKETYENTGYDVIALLSLSSVNYPFLGELVKILSAEFRDKGVGISIPSLRVDEAFYQLPEMIAAIKKTGLTFAPEAAGEELRKAIGKNIERSVLCRSAEIAYQNGWDKLKLYFMVGFPEKGEGEEKEILALARELSFLRCRSSKGPAEIKISVNPFIPKPHTAFQWLGMQSEEKLKASREFLFAHKPKRVMVEFNDIKRSLLEACISRGDRKVANAIYDAWRAGAKMDSWREFFNFGLWEDAFHKNGIDIHELATKTYDIDAPLPWSHIHTSAGQGSLKRHFLESGFASGQAA